MKLGKTLLTICLLLVIGFLGYTIYTLIPRDPCNTVLHYSIGRFDSNFGITKEEFLARIKVAESVWENAAHKDLFSYDPNAKFQINLIYDERQRETLLKQRTESGLEKAETVFKSIDDAFNKIKSEYETASASYQKAESDYNERRLAYEKEVEYWNKRGGAPEAQYNKLQKEADSLNSEAARLNEIAATLNGMQSKVKSSLANRNKAAEEYNKVVESFNERYGSGYEFDQAEYTGKQINVYQFTTNADLTLALAHEFGHALNVDHVENPKSIMYFETKESAPVSLSLTSEDLAEFARVCKSK